jgi:hypothetical protein
MTGTKPECATVAMGKKTAVAAVRLTGSQFLR